MQLSDLLEAVKERNLTKTALEEYRDEMTHLNTALHFEMAELEKEEALYIFNFTHVGEKKSQAEAERAWDITEKGRRQIDVNRSLKALAKELDSLKSRLYSIY
jgi:predicted nucleotide-binding protein (sugar kinase/HSP70/actin superfamily)